MRDASEVGQEIYGAVNLPHAASIILADRAQQAAETRRETVERCKEIIAEAKLSLPHSTGSWLKSPDAVLAALDRIKEESPT